MDRRLQIISVKVAIFAVIGLFNYVAFGPSLDASEMRETVGSIVYGEEIESIQDVIGAKPFVTETVYTDFYKYKGAPKPTTTDTVTAYIWRAETEYSSRYSRDFEYYVVFCDESDKIIRYHICSMQPTQEILHVLGYERLTYERLAPVAKLLKNKKSELRKFEKAVIKKIRDMLKTRTY